MSDGMKKALFWAAILLLVSYLMNINLAVFISSLIHAAQSVHQANGGH